MTSIADSSSVYDLQKQLVQHQAALTLLQDTLADPQIFEYRWLDLACGKGQIILHIEENLTSNARSKIAYYGYDVENEYLRYAERTAQLCGFKNVDIAVGMLSDFPNNIASELRFDFITLTNTIHEIRPKLLPKIIWDCLNRLTDSGSLFIYDMEQLPQAELGAITWTRLEIEELICVLCRSMEADTYVPAVGRWTHSRCFGWNLQIRKKHLNISSAQLSHVASKALSNMNSCVGKLLKSKLASCEASLDSLTRFGAETDEESRDVIQQLYDYWALKRELEEWS